jgi:hypothetical protein
MYFYFLFCPYWHLFLRIRCAKAHLSGTKALKQLHKLDESDRKVNKKLNKLVLGIVKLFHFYGNSILIAEGRGCPIYWHQNRKQRWRRGDLLFISKWGRRKGEGRPVLLVSKQGQTTEDGRSPLLHLRLAPF